MGEAQDVVQPGACGPGALFEQLANQACVALEWAGGRGEWADGGGGGAALFGG